MNNIITNLVCASCFAFTACGGDTNEDPTGQTDPTELTSEAYGAALLAGRWADDMTLTVDGSTLTITDDGIPAHDVLQVYAVPDGSMTAVLETPYTISIPLNPVLAAETTPTALGAMGVTVSGGLMFNPYEGGGDVALDGNFEVDGVPFIDACNGHPIGDGFQYHYHGVPYCITDVIDEPGEHATLLGVMLDGFPLYGVGGESGVAPTDLDECSGHDSATPEFPQGIYHYHLTETAPYSITCFKGEVEITNAMMGGGGGGTEAMACTAQMTTMCCGDGVCDGPETNANCSTDCM